MKPWMKIAVWFLLGGGIGFFGGWQLGCRKGAEIEEEESEACDEEEEERYTRNFVIPMDRYRGGDCDGDETTVIHNPKPAKLPDNQWPDEWFEDHGEDPEMPVEEPVIGDEESDEDEISEIRQLHPEDIQPHVLTEAEWEQNDKGYELKDLVFYAIDEVVYDPEAEEIVLDPDGLLGVGTLFGFGGDPNNPVEELYVENDTMGTLYRIKYLDAAFCDAVDGACPPSEEDDTE